MSIVKAISRKVIFPSVLSLGLEKMLPLFSSKRCLVLCYHGCNPKPDFNFNGRHIDSNQFEAHLLYYKRNFNIVSLNEMFRLHREGIVPDKKTVALSFDDGYLNNYTEVLPLLRKYEIPATFFIISSGLVDENYIMWPDILDIIKSSSEEISIESGGIIFNLVKGKGFYAGQSKISLFDHVKRMGKERGTFLAHLMKKTNFEKLLKETPLQNYKLISSAQLKKMAESEFVEIGSHTHLHYNLANVDSGLLVEELVKSKAIIEEVIGKEVNSIAFPDGSYNDEVKKRSLNAGYRNLLAVGSQCADDLSDRNILLRLTVSNTTTVESNMIQVNQGFKSRGF